MSANRLLFPVGCGRCLACRIGAALRAEFPDGLDESDAPQVIEVLGTVIATVLGLGGRGEALRIEPLLLRTEPTMTMETERVH